ncbi:MAG: ribonuclease D, partial [Alphaproteobacteria bacterium]|nr:ribonuclease D [Alphaproteobacteria bacterium]
MRVITTTKDLANACFDLARSDFVTVDTEFMREQTYWPELCLIQVASPNLELIIDPLSPNLDLSSFYELMADASVVKVFHAARQDIEIFVAQSNKVPIPLFDTQIAAMVCGFGESISYVNLVKKITDQNLDKSSRFTDWSQRPLSSKQLTYALGDVTHLRAVYLSLKTEIDEAKRADWLAEEMETLSNVETYITTPEHAWRRLKLRVKDRKALANLIEIAAWREAAAQSQNVPRGRILKDDALYDIANQSPTSVAELRKLRSVHDGVARSGRGRDILAALEKARARDCGTLPPLP